MIEYGTNRTSGVSKYALGADFIQICFVNSIYKYTYNHSLNGEVHIEKMKQLAKEGKGLTTYIAQNKVVKNNFQKSLI